MHIFGSKNDREIKKLIPYVATINAFEADLKQLSDEQLKAKTPYFKERLDNYAKAHGFDVATCDATQANQALWHILPEAFAVAREAGRRALSMRHYDVQLIGGMVLHTGRISEMRTGEGKTLVATLPLYLNALMGRGAHLVTVNDYLAKRDAEWMGRLYQALGMNVGIIVHEKDDLERQQAYRCDITYGQNNEFGFDYLRDNMKFRLEHYVQRELFFAIVDEVDSILIDEARTPLIISGPTEQSTDKYLIVNQIIPSLQREMDYNIEEKDKRVMLTESGVHHVEQMLKLENLYDPANIAFLHHVNQALRAHTLFKRDVDYVVQQGEVKIVDEFTGRIMEGRRWSDGLHQAIEAKEGVKIQKENQTLATITFQNYFRMYKKLGGMTGTAETEAAEFQQIYKLDAVMIPTNKTNIRADDQDVIYLTEKEKFEAIADDIVRAHQHKQPVLVGTVSVEKSEVISRLLKIKQVPHAVLNAKYHMAEAAIVAQAGRLGAVTIATNMAGRGTDILLGGNAEFLAKQEIGEEPSLLNFASESEYAQALQDYAARLAPVLERYQKQCQEERQQVASLGGLRIIGTERHESRRIDNQLRGRAGRQGDPGQSKFFLSLEDDLIRIFGGDSMKNMMMRLGMKPGEVIEHRFVTRSIENAQKRVEAHHFDSRKSLLEYDDVMNQQRKSVYTMRREVLSATKEQIKEKILDLYEEIIIRVATQAAVHANAKHEGLNTALIEEQALKFLNVRCERSELQGLSQEEVENYLFQKVYDVYRTKEQQTSEQSMQWAQFQKEVYLHAIDHYWKEHLLMMDHLKEGIGLRGYGQKDPKQEYKKEAYNLFMRMMNELQAHVVSMLSRVNVETEEAYLRRIEKERAQQQHMIEVHASAQDADSVLEPQALTPEPQDPQTRGIKLSAKAPPVLKPDPYRREKPKVGRNDLCHCGSGKKYKQCHLEQDEA